LRTNVGSMSHAQNTMRGAGAVAGSCGAASCSVPSQCSEGKTARPGVGQRLGEIQLRRSCCAACDNCSTGVGTFRTNVGSMSHEQNTMRGAGAVAAPLLARRNFRTEAATAPNCGAPRIFFDAAAAQLATYCSVGVGTLGRTPAASHCNRRSTNPPPTMG
jgi:hypothetical protein